MRGLALLAAAVSCGAVACSNGDAQVDPPTVLGMTDKMAAFYSDQQVSLYEVQTPVQLPVRRPTDEERAALHGQVAPYPRQPFLLASDERVEVRFTLTNVDDKEHVVELLLDPWNEFVKYHPGVQQVSDEETTPNFSGFDKFFVLPPKSHTTGTITSDDTNELAIDLATVENILSKPPDPMQMNGAMDQNALVNRAFNLQNRSNDGDPLITPFIPQVIAGLTGFDLGLRSYEPMNVAVEITVDVTDLNGNRIVQAGASDPKMAPPSTVIEPAGARN